jgi:hypothetical protein
MALYSFNNSLAGTEQALSASYKTILAVTAATGATTLRRGWLYEFEIGADAVPNSTDCPIIYNIMVQTAAGTITSVTPNPVDVGGGDAAALLNYGANATVEGTYTASSSLFYLGLNQRASQKQIFRDEKSSLIIPAVNLKGLAMCAKSPNYSGTVGWQAFISE